MYKVTFTASNPVPLNLITTISENENSDVTSRISEPADAPSDNIAKSIIASKSQSVASTVNSVTFTYS